MDLREFHRKKCIHHGSFNRRVNVIFRKESSSKNIDATMKVLKDFSENTTLLGVHHILRNKSLFWLLAYICCLSMSIVQTWTTASQYFEKKSHQRFGIESRQLMPFPSVTTCNNIILPKSLVNSTIIHGYNSSIEEFNDKFNISVDEIEKIRFNNNQAILKYVRSLSHSERLNRSIPLEKWLLKCTYQYQDCNLNDTKLFLKFNHPIDGSCITFNPAITNPGIEVDIDTKIRYVIELPENGYQIIGGRPRVSILIHSPGTTPLMDRPEAIDIYSNQNVNIGLRLTQKNFMLKNVKPTPTCVTDGESGQVYREKNLYYSVYWPYRYSVEACMKTCIQERVNNPCKVLDATFPILNSEYYKSFTLQIPPIVVCNETSMLEVSMQKCDCLFPCQIFQYYISTDTTEFTEEPVRPRNRKKRNTETNSMRVSVQFLTNIFDHIEEELDYNVTQFMGILGGNLSLWIGLCTISLLEIVELIWRLIAVRVKIWVARINPNS